MQITVDYQLTQGELARSMKRMLRKHRLKAVLVIAGFAAAGGFSAYEHQWIAAACCAFVAVSNLIAVLDAPYSFARENIKYLGDLTEATFTDTAFFLHTAMATSESRWERVEKTEETDEFFLFYIGGWVARAVPKRAFTPDAIEELRTLLASAPLGRALPTDALPS